MRTALTPHRSSIERRPIAHALLLFALAFSTTAIAERPARAQSGDVLDQLLEQARRWQARGRLDKAAEAYEKVLRSRPEDAEALEALGLWHAKAGRTDAAKEMLARLERQAPGSAGTNRLRAALSVGKGRDPLIEQARARVKASDVDGAVALYDQAFGGAKPPQHLALEYYQTLGGSKDGWERARAGLEELLKEKPSWKEAQFVYARHLTYNERTRRDGVDALAALSAESSQRAQAVAAWRNALLWLQLDARDAPRLKQYLDQVGDDEAVRQRLSSLSRGGSTVQRGVSAQAGYQALEADNLDEASRQFARAGDAPEAVVGLALVAMRKEDFELALKLLTGVSQRHPTKREIWEQPLRSTQFWSQVKRAEVVSRTSPSEAERLLREAIEVSPSESHHARVALATLLQASGRIEAAESELRQALEAQPEQPFLLRALVNIQVERGDYQTAIETNAKLAALSKPLSWPDGALEAEVLRKRAQERMAAGEVEEARKLLLEAVALAPQSYWAIHDLANAELALGERTSARERIERLLELKPSEAAGRILRARVEADLGRFDTALELIASLPASAGGGQVGKFREEVTLRRELDRVVRGSTRVGPYTARRDLMRLQKDTESRPELLGQVALAWAEIGEVGRGVELLQQVLAAQRKPQPGTQLQLAAIYLRGGMDEELRALLDELASDPNLPPRARIDLAKLHVAYAVGIADRLATAGEYNRALLQLEPLLAEYPEDPALLSALGRLFLQAGDYSRATATFTQVLRRDPSNSEARDGAVSAALAVGDMKRAKELVEIGLANQPRSPRVHLVAAHYALARQDDASAMRSFTTARKLAESGSVVPTVVGGKVATDSQGLLKAARADLAGETTTAAEGKDLVASIDKEMESVRARHKVELRLEPSFRLRNGETGLGRLSESRIPLTISVPLAYFGRLELTAEAVYLNAGKARLDQPDLAARFGSLGAIPAVAPRRAQDDVGIAPRLGVSFRDRVRVEIGTTPLGFLLHNVIGALSFQAQWKSYSLKLSAERKPVTDSLLSYAGTTDPATGRVWGGVTQQGGVLDFAADVKPLLFYAVGSFHYLLGKRVPDNYVGRLALGLIWTLYDWDGHSLRFGCSALGMAFDRNLSGFTLGQGGYFSPQWFARVGAPLGYGYLAERVQVRLEIDPGVNWFHRDASDYYPSERVLQTQREALMAGAASYSSNDNLGFSLNMVGDLRYTVARQLDLGIKGSMHFANDYEEYRVGAFAHVRFDRQVQTTNKAR